MSLYQRLVDSFTHNPVTPSLTIQVNQPSPSSPFHPLPGMEDVLKSITNGLVVCDDAKKVLFINPAMEQMTGLHQESFTLPAFFQLFIGLENNLETKLNEVLTTGQIFYVEDLVMHKAIYEMFITAVRDANNQISGAAIILHDITHIKEIDRVKTEFLSIAAHQLRTPLGSMRWNIELLLAGEMGEVAPQVKEILMQVYQGTQRMITLVADLLSVSRIDQNRVPDQPSQVDVVRVIRDVMKEIEFTTKKKSVSVILEIGSAQIPPIMVDSQHMRDVIQNLLSNAAKYSREGSTVSVKVKDENGNIQISVQDQGIGIPKKDQSKIFSKFFRADNATLSQTEGNGLGLYVVKSYVEAWGGRVWFESTEGVGTTFYLLLPEKPNLHVLDKNLENG